MYVLQIPRVLEPGDTTYVPQKQFWITALLGWYSQVSHASPRAASSSNDENSCYLSIFQEYVETCLFT